MAQHGMARGSSHIANPRHVVAEHRDEVSLSLHDDHHERERNGSAGPPADDLEGHQVIRSDTPRVQGGRASIEQPGQSAGAPTPVEPTFERSPRHADSDLSITILTS